MTERIKIRTFREAVQYLIDHHGMSGAKAVRLIQFSREPDRAQGFIIVLPNPGGIRKGETYAADKSLPPAQIPERLCSGVVLFHIGREQKHQMMVIHRHGIVRESGCGSAPDDLRVF